MVEDKRETTLISIQAGMLKVIEMEKAFLKQLLKVSEDIESMYVDLPELDGKSQNQI